jgi:hypothetical protein
VKVRPKKILIILLKKTVIKANQRRNETYVYEFLLPLIICPTGLVLEDHIVIPSAHPLVRPFVR